MVNALSSRMKTVADVTLFRENEIGIYFCDDLYAIISAFLLQYCIIEGGAAAALVVVHSMQTQKHEKQALEMNARTELSWSYL